MWNKYKNISLKKKILRESHSNLSLFLKHFKRYVKNQGFGKKIMKFIFCYSFSGLMTEKSTQEINKTNL